MISDLGVTHFIAEDRQSTLCGLPGGPWGIIDNDRPASCTTCRKAHQRAGWTFPLPEVVVPIESNDPA